MTLRSLIVPVLLLAALSLPAPADETTTKPVSLEEQLAAANQTIVELQMENAALKQQLDEAQQAAKTAALQQKAASAAAPQVVLQEHDNGSVRAMRRIVRDRIKIGMPFSEASGLLDKPIDTKRDGNRDVYTYRRVDAGQQNHGMTTQGARYTLTLKVSDGVVESIDATGR